MENIQLTNDQQKIMNNILNSDSEHCIHYLKGYAGTGKTITSSEIVRYLVKNSYQKVLIVAPTATALANIRKKIDASIGPSHRVYFKTLAALIKRVDNVIVSPMGMKFKLDGNGINAFTQFLKGAKLNPDNFIKKVNTQGDTDYLIKTTELNFELYNKLHTEFNFSLDTEFNLMSNDDIKNIIARYDFILVDESSMVNSEEMQALNKAVKESIPADEINDEFGEALVKSQTKKIVWVGDDKQLPAVDGKPSSEFTNNKDNVLTEILRSNDKIINYATKVRNGSINSLLGITTVANNLDDYINDNLNELLNYNVFLTFTNKAVNTINSLARAKFTNSPILTVGEPIVINQNARNSEGGVILYNSQRLKISQVFDKDYTQNFIENIFNMLDINDYEDERFLHYESFIKDNKIRLIKVKDEVTQNEYAVLANINMHNNYLNSYERQIVELITKACQSEFENLTYIYWKSAYAMTVHKAQGSEWDKVIYVYQLNRRNFKQNNNLDYTAITRAKNDIKIIGYIK